MTKFSPSNFHILIVDDNPSIREINKEHLTDLGYRITVAGDAETAREAFTEEDIDVVLLDINLPESNGIDLLTEFKEKDEEVLVIMISAIKDIETVVQAMQYGAYDYLVKPIIDLNQVSWRIEKALSAMELETENQNLRAELDRQADIPELQSRSASMKKVKDMIKTVARYDSTVLITGESGTGKEVAARTIHRYSDRSEKPFIAVNCGGIPPSLLESTLFGYEKGAFTGAVQQSRGLFEESDQGTIFLDEVTETTPEFQVKLLRVFEDQRIRRVGSTQEIELDLRIIAATNKDMKQRVDEGQFREDLYYRLNVVNVELPPLRDRKEDIPLIVSYQLEQIGDRLGRTDIEITPEVLSIFQNYDWPGNIRELINVLESGLIMSDGEHITMDDLPSYFKRDLQVEHTYNSEIKSFQEEKEQFERQYFSAVLDLAEGNVTEAARKADVTRQHLYHKIKQLGLRD